MTGKQLARLGVCLLALSAATACGRTEIYRDFFREAGASLDEGRFGNPTMNNIQVHTGQRSYLTNLNTRFAAEVPTTINFAFNSARLDAEARAVLDQQANWMRQFPEIRFRVYGHTDLVGSNAYNKRLGRRRAQAVVAYLGTRGISRSRLEALVSFGETRPIVLTENRERRNRRTVTEVSGFVGTHPMVLNGKYAAIVFREYVASATTSTEGGGSVPIASDAASSGSPSGGAAGG